MVSGLLVFAWLAPVVAQQGTSGILSASHTGGLLTLSGLNLFISSPLDEPFFPLLVALGLTGAIWCIAKRQWLLPLWFLVMVVFDPRKGATFATIPVSLMAAIALQDVLLPAFRAQSDTLAHAPLTRYTPAQRTVLYSFLTFGLLSSCAATFADDSPLRPISPANRDLMAWTKENTPADARFAVVAGDVFWATDATSEWFPYLAGRMSVGTVQGYEWLGPNRLADQVQAHEELSQCQSVACLDAWSEEYHLEFDYVLAGRSPFEGYAVDEGADCCAALRNSLSLDPEYELVQANSAGSIYKRTGSSSAVPPN
jgi:hypothetical protein